MTRHCGRSRRSAWKEEFMKRETESLGSVAGPDRGIEARRQGKRAVAHGFLPHFWAVLIAFYALKNARNRAIWRSFAKATRHASFLSPFKSVEA